MTLRGTSVIRREDDHLLRGQGEFVSNMAPADTAFVHYVASTMAHAELRKVDVSAAQAAPGVLAVVVHADLDIGPYPAASPAFDAAMVRPLLADARVRFVGEPIAAIVATSVAAAADAAELVEIAYEPLPAITDVEAALEPDAVQLFAAAADGNVVCRLATKDMTADFTNCDVVCEVRSVNNRLAPAPLETRVASAYWDENGRLIHLNAGQGPHPVRSALCAILGLDKEQVRVISRDVGGSFGAKARPSPEEVLLGWLSRRLGVPVTWLPPRSADMVGLVHGRGQVQYMKIGGMRNGRITAYSLHVVQESGGYASMGAGLPGNCLTMLSGCYDIASVGFTSTSVVTNTTPIGPYRGAGRPEAAAAIERAVDAFATAIQMDPAAVRSKNFLAPEAFPLVTPTGSPYDSGQYEAAQAAVLAAAGYDELRAEQVRRLAADEDRWLGIGLSTYVERTAGVGRSEYGAVELVKGNDGVGHIVARTGSSPYGQGHHTAWAMLIADSTGMPYEDIEVIHGDTDLVPSGGVTGGSRSLQLAGAAIWEASKALVKQAVAVAAELLEAAEGDVQLDVETGRFAVVGTPAISVGWDDVAGLLADKGNGPRLLHAEEEFESEGPTFPFGAHLAVVEVDRHTGEVVLQRLVACDDAGTILNPLLAAGQVHGGLGQGAAQALLEEFVYDEDGNPLSGNFADYPVISAAELPLFELVKMETPTHINPLGAKGIGEAGSVGATPAIQNAVINALSHLGVTHLDMPLRPERIWRAISQAASGK